MQGRTTTARDRRVPWVLAVVVIATLYAVTIAVTGGFNFQIAGMRLRSRSWVRPALLALAGVAVLVLLIRDRLPAISARVSRLLESSGVATWPTWLTVAATAWALAAGVVFGTFASGGADSYGYVAQARLFAHGHLTDTIPSSADYTWPNVESTFTPLGFRPGLIRGVIAPTYPPGFPLLLAPLAACSERLIYLLVPVFGALLVWNIYRMGAALGDPPAGAMAAALLSVSPTFLYQVVQPMSDVPAAACWLGALLLAVRGTSYAAAGSGAICSLAILIRPNLAPLAGLIATAAIFSRSSFRLRRAVLFAGALVPGLVTLGWIQNVRYGSPWRQDTARCRINSRCSTSRRISRAIPAGSRKPTRGSSGCPLRRLSGSRGARRGRFSPGRPSRSRSRHGHRICRMSIFIRTSGSTLDFCSPQLR